MEAVIALFVILVVVGIVIAALGLRIIRPYEKGLIEMLGRYQRTVDSGLRWILPFVKRLNKVDMRERVIDVPPQEVITKDNVVVTVDAVIFFEATDPVKLKYNVGNFQLAVTKLAQTNLRNVIGDLDLDAALTSRELINGKLREILDDATDKWGTRVVRVEIQRIDPPPDVTEAMHRQMKAERDRRAVVTEAEGDKRSAILRSEGLKESQILEAEGEAEALKRVADGERYQRETVALGEANAIERVFGAIHTGDPTPDLIAIRYLEALRYVADGNATKIFLPLDTSGLTNAMASLSEIARAGQGDPASRPAEE
ncbi:SPFH domain-containing protein [Candidatus Poriferisocius sp.]|uniref:SPFH domain-containing protein n=1 Tax=Candidatus Poriferisocius sp. TaxID=3101276 RepID=UPI003B014B47